ncbi:MAG TPA: hypothetical protein VF711_10395 [Acidimicrobiales bacterium]
MAEQLRMEGFQQPELAAAVLAARARLGLDRSSFAGALGLPPSVLDELESGQLPPEATPVALASLISEA